MSRKGKGERLVRSGCALKHVAQARKRFNVAAEGRKRILYFIRSSHRLDTSASAEWVSLLKFAYASKENRSISSQYKLEQLKNVYSFDLVKYIISWSRVLHEKTLAIDQHIAPCFDRCLTLLACFRSTLPVNERNIGRIIRAH